MESLWTPKIYTANGFIKENILEGKKALDVGCGQRKLPGSLGIDINKDSQADIIHDINQIPWPFGSNSFDIIVFNQSLEHANDIFKTLDEAYRLAKPLGRIIIQVPYFRSVDASADPTHKHFFTAQSLDYAVEGAGLGRYKYTPLKFRKIGFWYGWPQPSKNSFKQVIKNFIQKHQDFYDQYLSLVLPVECLTWEIEVIKNDKEKL